MYLYSLIAYGLLRLKQKEFEFVYVDLDGPVRELYQDGVAYLSGKFYGGDGGGPYIKHSYHQETPDGKISGFIPRRRVLKKIPVNRIDPVY